MKTITYSVLALLAGVCIGNIMSVHLRPHRSSATYGSDTVRLLQVDTIRLRDTIRISIPTYSETATHRHATVNNRDILHRDSDSVTLQAVQRVYTAPTFRAVISGIDPRLDSLTISRTNHTVTRTIARNNPISSTRPPSRWSIGITAGASFTPHGLTPGVTLGLTYRLWP